MLALVGPENFDPPMPGLHTEAGVRAVLGFLGFLGFTAFVPAAIGTLAVTSEHRHRTITFTFLYAPDRWRVPAAPINAAISLYGKWVMASSGGIAIRERGLVFLTDTFYRERETRG
ncbi:hypothetical protein [Nonomuraea candida]|uniref:hypothetical protein n=1 Tax=Nonomuraea candida TaxID=359159 RepID=UPI000693612D|nr:hypothetical protein [Nonomuraea candida]